MPCDWIHYDVIHAECRLVQQVLSQLPGHEAGKSSSPNLKPESILINRFSSFPSMDYRDGDILEIFLIDFVIS